MQLFTYFELGFFKKWSWTWFLGLMNEVGAQSYKYTEIERKHTINTPIDRTRFFGCPDMYKEDYHLKTQHTRSK